jgi:hypothetical protein
MIFIFGCRGIGSACGPSERERASESAWGWGPARIKKGCNA